MALFCADCGLTTSSLCPNPRRQVVDLQDLIANPFGSGDLSGSKPSAAGCTRMAHIATATINQYDKIKAHPALHAHQDATPKFEAG